MSVSSKTQLILFYGDNSMQFANQTLVQILNSVIIKSDMLSYTLSEDMDWINCRSHSGGYSG